MDYLRNKLTGRQRHRIQKIGWLKPKYVLVLQYEVEGFVPEWIGGRADGSIMRWWEDAKPEWKLTEGKEQ